jgi:hypothetical protein
MDGPNDIHLTDPDLVRDIRARAEATGRGVEAVVREAIAASAPPVPPPRQRTPEEIAELVAALEELSRRAKAIAPDLTSNHDWLYDENGLPV